MRHLRRALPEGSLLPEELWQRRHRSIVALLWVLSAGLVAFAARGSGPLEALATGAPVAACALLAAWGRPGRKVRTVASSIGLMSAAALLVHAWGGQSEAHFAFFVVIGILAL